MRHLVALSAMLLVAGCSSVPRYKEPRGLIEANSVSINRWSVFPTCKFQGLAGPDGQLACEAKLLLVDGQRAFQVNSRLSLGEHTLVLSCTFGPASPNTIPIPMNIATIDPIRYSHRQYQVRFDSDAYYRLEAHWEGEACKVRMLDATTGAAFPLGEGVPWPPPMPAVATSPQ